MRVLAFDTCFSACSVAVVDTDRAHAWSKPVGAQIEIMERGHAERLLPMIADVMRRGDVSFDDLDCIATANGPGTFTGMRIAVSAARALSLSTGLPVYSYSSLALLAAQYWCRADCGAIQGTDRRTIAATMDARKSEIYVQLFDDPRSPSLCAPQVMSPRDAANLTDTPIVAIGGGAQALGDARAASGLAFEVGYLDLQPDAAFACCIHLEPTKSLAPLYLRAPDAKPQSDQSIARI